MLGLLSLLSSFILYCNLTGYRLSLNISYSHFKGCILMKVKIHIFFFFYTFSCFFILLKSLSSNCFNEKQTFIERFYLSLVWQDFQEAFVFSLIFSFWLWYTWQILIFMLQLNVTCKIFHFAKHLIDFWLK